jgi:Protein of unknown function (DUF2939)
MRRALAAFTVLAAALAGCSTIPRYEAANDIHAFLVAIRDGDRAGFDEHVDKPALKTNLKGRLLSEAGRQDQLGGIGALLAGPLVDLAVDAGARPEVFRAVAAEYGYAPDKPLPSTLVIAGLVRPLEGGRACTVARHGGSCMFIFKNEDGVWRLIDFEGHLHLDKGRLKVTE